MTPAEKKLWQAKERLQIVLAAGDKPIKEARAAWRARAKLGAAQQAAAVATAALEDAKPLKATYVWRRLTRAERDVLRARAALGPEAGERRP